MSKVRIPINPLQVGRVGAYSMYVRGGEQIVRQRRNASNYGESAMRSLAQQTRRVKWSNLVAMFRTMAFWQPKAYEALRAGQTDYNKFMSINIDTNTVAFTKEQASSGAVVIEPMIVSQGSLVSANASWSGGNTTVLLDLVIRGEETGAPATLGELASRIIANTPGWQDGDNLAFVCFTNEKDATDIPRASCKYFEYTLDVNSTDALNTNELVAAIDDIATNNAFEVTFGSLMAGASAFVAVHTRQDSTGLKVSTERIYVFDDELVQEFSTAAQVEAAIASYGLSTTVLLEPGGSVQ